MQTRLAENAFSNFLTAEDKELTQLGTIKMILMEQVQRMACFFNTQLYKDNGLENHNAESSELQPLHICQTYQWL